MVDKLTQEKRSWNMGRVRNKHTKPELIVRSLLHREGYRFRLHKKELPGRPDIVLPKFNIVVLVHGCFWHRHKNCSDATTPKTRTDFWKNKFAENEERDRRTKKALQQAGWKVIVIWECETSRPADLLKRLDREIRDSSNKPINMDAK